MSNNQPRYIAYSLKEREGKPSSWRMIGVAFSNSKKPGFAIQLDALPIGDRIVLLEPSDEQKDATAGNGGAQ